MTQKIQEIEHPVVQAVLNHLNFHEDSIEIHHGADLPARAGLGSSSAFTVGLLNALIHLREGAINSTELAKLAIHVEQDLLGEVVGFQDQTLTAHGGFNRIDFYCDGRTQVTPIFSSHLNKLQDHLMLFYTGYSRFASDIAQSKVVNFKKNVTRLYRLREMVDEAFEKLQDSRTDIFWFGELLDEAWQIKSKLSDKVSNASIDEIYRCAKCAGAIGGKILGAGGGGFMLFFVSPDKQLSVKRALSHIPKLCHIPFEFENNGSHFLFDSEKELTLQI